MKGEPVNLFTVQLEIGPETRAMIERVAANAVMHFELGPKTREMIEALPSKDSNKAKTRACCEKVSTCALRRKRRAEDDADQPPALVVGRSARIGSGGAAASAAGHLILTVGETVIMTAEMTVGSRPPIADPGRAAS